MASIDIHLEPDMTSSTPTTLAILGPGTVGTTLAKGFAARGDRVVFGSRDSAGTKARAALDAVPGSTVASLVDAARQADSAVIALPWTAVKSALTPAVADALAGKTVIDAVNPVDFSSGQPVLALGFTDSAGETVQRLLPQSKVVKAFNIITASHMVQPKLADGEPDMFIAGNDAGAKATVAAILRSFGWRSAIDLGGIEQARLLESLAMLWIRYGFGNNHWSHGFSLLNRKPD
jgi:NADPH-dependent F420 reductase